MILGITGNSGSGKTSFCKVLENKYNAFVIDADVIVSEFSKPHQQYFNEIVNIFGYSILNKNGELDKAKLADIIFTDCEKRKTLNAITYKYIVGEIKNRVKLSKSKFIIIDAVLLIESGLNKICDSVISVVANEEIKTQRICLRDYISINVAKKRLRAQQKDEFYIKNSNYVIINNDIDIEKQVEDIIQFTNSDILYNPETVIIQDGDLKIMQFKKLLKYSDIVTHAFTLKPLDFGNNNTYFEKKDEIDDNYKKVCNLLKLDVKNIIRACQTHTNNVKKVEKQVRDF